jgi:LacI family transcriptional regulator
MATKHLLDCGCQHVALVSAIDFLSVGKDRVKGFASKVEETQGHVDHEMIIRCSVDELEQRVNHILESRPVDGFFAVDEDASLAICKVAKKKGIRVPEELSIIGYAGEKLATNVAPGLTTVNQNGVSIGREAARIMLDRIESAKEPFTKKVISTTIERRASTKR